MEILLASSEEPLVQVLKSTLPLNSAFTNCKGVLFFLIKYIRGNTPPTDWLTAVAIAAPSPFKNGHKKKVQKNIRKPCRDRNRQTQLGFFRRHKKALKYILQNKRG